MHLQHLLHVCASVMRALSQHLIPIAYAHARVRACPLNPGGPLKEEIHKGVGKGVLSVEGLEHVSIHAIIGALVDGPTRDLARGRRKR